MFKGIERRSSARRRESHIIQFFIEAFKTPHLFYGVTGNISDSGLWLYTVQSLSKGETVVFKYYKPLAFRRGIVRWMKKVEPKLYQVGIECYNSPPG